MTDDGRQTEDIIMTDTDTATDTTSIRHRAGRYFGRSIRDGHLYRSIILGFILADTGHRMDMVHAVRRHPFMNGHGRRTR